MKYRLIGVNTKLVLGLPRANQVGFEQAKKNLRRCERWLQDPPSGMSMLTDSTGFFLRLPLGAGVGWVSNAHPS